MGKNIRKSASIAGLTILLLSTAFLLNSCGFKLQGDVKLPPALHRIYIESPEPYSQLTRNLKQSLKLSNAVIVDSPGDASAILALHAENASQQLISVNATQQTRQYTLILSTGFVIKDNKGHTLVPLEMLSESRAITIQSNQILGTSNEANMLYLQMRQGLAYAIINRISSAQIANMIQKNYENKPE